MNRVDLHFPVKGCVRQHLCDQLNMCMCVLPGGYVDCCNMLLVRSCKLKHTGDFYSAAAQDNSLFITWFNILEHIAKG